MPAVRRNPIPFLIFVLALVGLLAAYAFFNRTIVSRYVAARHVLNRRSEIRLSLTVDHATGPLVRETYEMSDVEGVSASSYRVAGRSGTTVTIVERPERTLDPDANVAFFFGKTVQDGIWELTNRPPRGDAGTRYTVHVYQFADGQHGSRDYTFTDPHYWATTGGHQFHITLDKNKPVPDLLQMTSTVVVEPRYAALVDDFRAFGPERFRKKSADARTRAGARS
ncbi:MAG: hypothetical protein IAI48_04410 [Candidatus Eremiobacteraeota bacterium]|nr:hypothetical protein [Candidatus Eremiobacteraeota bacterium]